jgi:hypothetical protein
MPIKLSIDLTHNTTPGHDGELINKDPQKHICFDCSHNGMQFTSAAGIPCEYAFTVGLIKCPGYWEDRGF